LRREQELGAYLLEEVDDESVRRSRRGMEKEVPSGGNVGGPGLQR